MARAPLAALVGRQHLLGEFGTHPGGGVTGASAYNAAQAILRDLHYFPRPRKGGVREKELRKDARWKIQRELAVLVRRVGRIVCLSLLCLVVVLSVAREPTGGPAWGAESPAHQREWARITALLDAVERSGAKFIREGRDHSARDARKHLERKLRRAGQRVKTAEEFIEGVATRSSTTGRPYLVRLPSGEQVESGPWMRQRLAEIDARRQPL